MECYKGFWIFLNVSQIAFRFVYSISLGSRRMGKSAGSLYDCLRIFQHTPVTYAQDPQPRVCDSEFLCILGGVGECCRGMLGFLGIDIQMLGIFDIQTSGTLIQKCWSQRFGASENWGLSKGRGVTGNRIGVLRERSGTIEKIVWLDVQGYIPPPPQKISMSPEKGRHFKSKVVFQLSFLRVQTVSFRGSVIHIPSYN